SRSTGSNSRDFENCCGWSDESGSEPIDGKLRQTRTAANASTRCCCRKTDNRPIRGEHSGRQTLQTRHSFLIFPTWFFKVLSRLVADGLTQLQLLQNLHVKQADPEWKNAWPRTLSLMRKTDTV